jgi:hypothetical protein
MPCSSPNPTLVAARCSSSTPRSQQATAFLESNSGLAAYWRGFRLDRHGRQAMAILEQEAPECMTAGIVLLRAIERERI